MVFPLRAFALGFRRIYGQHYNSQTGTYGFLMLMPSGSRVELRRIGSTSAYEAADSSYLQLIDNGMVLFSYVRRMALGFYTFRPATGIAVLRSRIETATIWTS